MLQGVAKLELFITDKYTLVKHSFRGDRQSSLKCKPCHKYVLKYEARHQDIALQALMLRPL